MRNHGISVSFNFANIIGGSSTQLSERKISQSMHNSKENHDDKMNTLKQTYIIQCWCV